MDLLTPKFYYMDVYKVLFTSYPATVSFFLVYANGLQRNWYAKPF